MTEPHKPYHLIVFGATSFVGQILTRYLAGRYGIGGGLKWAIAGRSQSKLEQLRAGLKPASGAAGELPLLLADAGNDEQLWALCGQTRAIVSTVGPYALYGEPLVRACAETGTDYCDLTGEPQWIRKMIDRYEDIARASGARIVHCCGFDSLPSDLGVHFLQQEAIRRYGCPASGVKMRVKAAKGGLSGGTFASMLELTREVMADPALKKLLANPYALCPAGHGFRTRQHNQKGLAKDTDLLSWSVPFIMAAINTRVVHRSNALLDNGYGDDFRYDEAMLCGRGLRGWLTGAMIVGGLGAFLLAAAWRPTRTLLQRYVLPKPGEGPGTEQQQQGYFDIRFIGRTSDGHTLVSKVTGDRDPGYGSTAKMLGEAVVALACDCYDPQGNKQYHPGGFPTPAAMFGQLLTERLQQNAGLTFEILG